MTPTLTGSSRRSRYWIAVALLGACAASSNLSSLTLTSRAMAGDWYRWRGPFQSSRSDEKGLPAKFDPDTGENLVWKAPVGGLCNPIVMRGKFYTITRTGDQPAGDDLLPTPSTREIIVCLDAATGAVVWQKEQNIFQTRVPFHRVGWGSPVGDPETGRVYTLGAQCTLRCWDGDTGAIVWERQLTEEIGLISTFGGRTNTPLIDEDQIIVPGVTFGWGDDARGQYRLTAFDKATGELRWSAPTGGRPVDAPYQTPVVTVVDGVRLVICAAGDGGVHGFQIRTGKKLWSFSASQRGLNASVVPDGHRLYISHGEENLDSTSMGRAWCLDLRGGKPKILWQADVACGYCSPSLADGKLYIMEDGGKLVCLNADSGEKIWEKKLGTIGRPSPLIADGKIYIPEANGRVWVLPAGTADEVKRARPVANLSAKRGREYAIFGSMAVSNGRLYLQCANETYCFGSKEGVTTPTPKAEFEPEAAPGKAALVQVLPTDVVVEPGQTQAFRVRVFDANGNAVPSAAGAAALVTWAVGKLSLALPKQEPIDIGNLGGSIDNSGVYTAGPAPVFQGGAVTASVHGISGSARVRVLPPPPYTFDFEKTPAGRAPLTAVGAGGKYEVRKLSDGNSVLVKFARTDNSDTKDAPLDPRYLPLYDQAWTYLGRVSQANYTVQVEARTAGYELEVAGVKQTQMGDMGVVNSRYALVLLGNHQKLTLHTWPGAMPFCRNKTIEHSWKANTWYVLKLSVMVVDGKAHVTGKVWERGQPEPANWTLDFTDDTPNTHGSPGLYSFSNKANQVYFDNLTVTPNAGAAPQK